MTQSAIVGSIIVVALVVCAIVVEYTLHSIAKRRRIRESDDQAPKPETKGGRRRQEN